MVMLISLDPAPTFEVLDADGRVIGKVVGPAEPELVGPGKGTVLLRRPAPTLESRRPQHAA
jgi:hypothetical protein